MVAPAARELCREPRYRHTLIYGAGHIHLHSAVRLPDKHLQFIRTLLRIQNRLSRVPICQECIVMPLTRTYILGF